MISAVKLLFSFQGRIGRADWWFGQIAGLLVSICVIWCVSFITNFAIDVMLRSDPKFQQYDDLERAVISANSFFVLRNVPSVLFVGWISTALAVKRLHDRDKAGWWILIYFIPALLTFVSPSTIIALAALFAKILYPLELGALAGTSGNNSYGGDDPSLCERLAHALPATAAATPASQAPPTEEPPQRTPGTQRPRLNSGPTGFGKRPKHA